MGYKKFFERHGEDNLMYHDYPEHGPGVLK
jgi:hypothetical protein